jgi:integrase
MFADFLIDAGKLKENPVKKGGIRRLADGSVLRTKRGLVPIPDRLPKIPSEQQWIDLLGVIRRRNARDRLMFVLAYDCALRRNELTHLLLTDFDFSARQLTVRPEISKNGGSRTLPYSETADQLLRAYLPDRKATKPTSNYLFVSASPRNSGQSLTGFTWGVVASQIGKAARNPAFTTHTLRHLRLTDLARAGFDVVSISSVAGHRSLESTMVYIHLSGRDISLAFQRAVGHLPPRFDLL